MNVWYDDSMSQISSRTRGAAIAPRIFSRAISDISVLIFAIKSLNEEVLDIGDAQIISRLNDLQSLAIEFGINQNDFVAAYKKLSYYQTLGINFVNITEKAYPQALLDLPNPPSIIYFYGSFESLKALNKESSISVVGTRNASLYGKHLTRAVVQSMQDYECSIVSGLARGIDSESHLTAMESGLSTVAVIASGLLKFAYSGLQKKLFNQMQVSDKHLIISEFSPEFPAQRWTFVHRNRIIAALSKANFVIEASLKSGSLSTANYAAKLKREIYSIPGDISKDSFKGSNHLIEKDIAKPIYSISSVNNFLDLCPKPRLHQKSTSSQLGLSDAKSKKIIDCLGIEPVSFDFLIQQLKMNRISLMQELTKLEVQGYIERQAGGLYSKQQLV